VMPFRDRETVVLELYGRNAVRSLGAARVTAAARPADYVWMGLRDRQLFGITRSAWQATIGGPDVTMLVVVVPHALSPATLIPSLEGPGPAGDPGTRAIDVIEDGASAHVFSVSPSQARAGAEHLSLHLDATTAAAWLAFGGQHALERLAAARPVVAPDASLDGLRSTVAGAACLSAAGANYPAGWLRLVPRGPSCPPSTP